MADLLKVSDVLTYLCDQVTQIADTDLVPLIQAHGRFLAEDQIATLDVPPENNSAMDGFAVRFSDLVIDGKLPVSQRIPAGHLTQALEHGSAARVFTGSEMPAGANTVVIQENCTYQKDSGHVVIHKLPTEGAGDNVRLRGADVRCGEVLLRKGQQLRAPELGLLASIGVIKVPVFRQLKVAIVSTGDELVDPGESLESGQIYNSSRYLMTGLLQGLNIEIVDGGCAKDDPEEIEFLLNQAARNSDCVICTGGVSVGEEDHVKKVLARLGQQEFWKIAVKPGKPMVYGSVCGTPFFGLPGNPVSTFVTFLLFTKPYLLAMQGGRFALPRRFQVESGVPLYGSPSREEYARANIEERDGRSVVVPLNDQSSGVLTSTSRAEVLIVVPVKSNIQVGDLVDVIPIDTLLT